LSLATYFFPFLHVFYVWCLIAPCFKWIRGPFSLGSFWGRQTVNLTCSGGTVSCFSGRQPFERVIRPPMGDCWFSACKPSVQSSRRGTRILSRASPPPGSYRRDVRSTAVEAAKALPPLLFTWPLPKFWPRPPIVTLPPFPHNLFRFCSAVF